MTTFNDSLQEFSTRRNTLMQAGEDLRLFLEESGMPDKAREVSGHLLRLELDSVKVAVIGEFKGGKSTLVNAILGQEILPSWTVECTAAITQVGYGEQPGMIVHSTDGKQEKQPLERLKELATTRNDQFDGIAYIEAQYPAAPLKNGLVIVDTPGTNSAVKARELITKRFMRIADAAILVLNVECLLRQSEVQFIRDEISQSNYGSVFVVVNRCDLVRNKPEQLRQALNQTTIKLKELIPSLERIYPLSAREALKGRQGNVAELIASSGIEALENDLGRYVAERSALDRLERVRTAFLEILADAARDSLIRLETLSLDKEKADLQARKAAEALRREGDSLKGLKEQIHEGFIGFRERLADDIAVKAEESRRNLESLYGGTHQEPPEPEVVAERIRRDSAAWLAHSEQRWGAFHTDVMVRTANYLSRVDQELAEGLTPASAGSLTAVTFSPVRVEVMTQVREQTDYIEEYREKPHQSNHGINGLGIGLLVGGLILGGWLGAGLAIFGGASLFSGAASWDEDELEKIRKPVTKQIKEFSLASLQEPYNRLTTEMMSHLDKVLNGALKSLLGQVEKISHTHHENIRRRSAEIERQRTDGEAPREVARLSRILSRAEEITARLKGAAST
jgi:signal recognition particle receptor subunit beta